MFLNVCSTCQSYERDNFRKPAGEDWLSDHAALQSALSAAKDEAKSLRKAAEGQVSALEAGRLRGRVDKAEAALGAAITQRYGNSSLRQRVYLAFDP